MDTDEKPKCPHSKDLIFDLYHFLMHLVLAIDRAICRGQFDVADRKKIAPNPVTPIALKTLGDSLKNLGYHDTAITVLKQALNLGDRADLWNSLGAVYEESKQDRPAIDAYEMVIKLAQPSHDIQVISNAKMELLELRQQFDRESIQAIDLSGLLGIQTAQAHLKLARIIESQQPDLALVQAQAALTIGQTFNHPRTEATALGLIGKLQQDVVVIKQAIALAQSVQAWDLAYPSQALLGEIYTRNHQPQLATVAYRDAMVNVENVRQLLRGTAANRRFDFYGETEPIYRQYLELLFDNPDRSEEIIQASTNFQIAELENFLGCPLEDWIQIAQVQPIADTTLVFVTRGTHHYHVILRSVGRPEYRYSIDAASLEPAVDNLVTNVRVGQLAHLEPEVILNHGKRLYAVLLKPAAAQLPEAGTIVFVLDPELQNLPLDFLHNGKEYLLRKYSMSVTLGAQLRQPKALAPDQLKVLLAGISDIAPSFKSNTKILSQTQDELIQIRHNVPGKILLNQDFTIERLRQQLSKGRYPIVHLSTHGTFSSKPGETGILAWNRQLDMAELRDMIEQNRQRPIELLVPA
jgi:CHAT domain-containing protein